MNQKYLQGISSDMENLDSVVFFEATPENISAFFGTTPMGRYGCYWHYKRSVILNCKNGLDRHLSGSRIFGEKDSSDLC